MLKLENISAFYGESLAINKINLDTRWQALLIISRY